MNWGTETLRFDHLAKFIAVFVGVFSVLTIVYSTGFMRRQKGLWRYYLYIILTCVVSLGAVFSNNLALFMVFWGFLGLLLYLLIDFGESERAPYTAKKAFIIIGGTDAFMLLGLALVWHLVGRPSLLHLEMASIRLPLAGKLNVAAYLCLAVGALAKAGAMPFHTWVPDTAEDAPTPVTAFLPASLDKLLGIYFLVRISLGMFQMTPGMNTLLLALGSVTIVAGVMMALVQHDMKRLLGYHAVSQVGYMVLGIGTGTAIGMAGALFHMLNNAIYKSCLFLSAGSVEKRSGTCNLDKLGGYAKTMPIAFVTFLIAALAISGVPPLNGFASKWMIYQGIIEGGNAGGGLWLLWLLAAMFGSALTLASFMKLIHAVFLGQPSREGARDAHTAKEVGAAMWLPTSILAALCVVFGVFAYSVPFTYFIQPSLPGVTFLGAWHPVVAAALILIGLLAGVTIYFLGRGIKTRTAEPFVGGEILERHAGMRVSGVDFYKTIQDIRPLGVIYRLAEAKLFDVYEVGSQLTFAFSRILGFFHNGVLPRYLAWCLLGLVILLYALLR